MLCRNEQHSGAAQCRPDQVAAGGAVHIGTDGGRGTDHNAPYAGITPLQEKEQKMGDRGGKKDKDKNKRQETKKHQEEAQRKQDKAPPKP